MYCEKCGTQLPDGTKFCGSCGAKTEAVQEQPAAPSYAPPAAPQPPRQEYYAPQPNVHSSSYSNTSEPLSVGQYILMFIVYAIPLVNIIMMFVWGFGSEPNLNRKNFARATLIIAAVGIVLWIIFAVALGGIFSALIDSFDSSSYSY